MKTLNIVKFLFATIGGICLVAATSLCLSEIKFKRNAVDLNGVVVNFRGNGIGPTYSYEYPVGIQHRKSSNASSSEWDWMDGDSIPLQVDSRNPAKAQIRSFVDQWFACTLLAIFGIIFGGVGFGMIYHGIRRSRIQKLLMDRGNKIRAKVSSIGMDDSTTYNGRNPFVVHAEARIDGAMYLFDSENIWFDPTPYFKGAEVDVYHLPEKPETYYMDLSFLPKVTR